MAFEMRDNAIILFPNEKRSDLKGPVVTGSVKIDGTTFKVSGWKDKDGTIFGKLSLKEGNTFFIKGDFRFATNDKKKKENQPDRSGTLRLEGGKEFELALWLKTGTRGQFLSGVIKDPADRKEKPVSVKPIDNSDLLF